MSADWDQIIFFEGEDPQALETRFVELSAIYKQHTPFEIATEVFRTLREPTRAFKAADVWEKSVAVKERIRLLKLKGPPVVDCTESDLIRRSLAVADNDRTEPKDKIAAIRLAGELQGFVKKSIDARVSAPTNGNDFLAALAAKLPT